MKKIQITALIILCVGLAMWIAGATVGGLTTTGTGFQISGLVGALSNIGYLATVFSGVVLVGTTVAGAVRDEDKKK